MGAEILCFPAVLILLEGRLFEANVLCPPGALCIITGKMGGADLCSHKPLYYYKIYGVGQRPLSSWNFLYYSRRDGRG